MTEDRSRARWSAWFARALRYRTAARQERRKLDAQRDVYAVQRVSYDGPGAVTLLAARNYEECGRCLLAHEDLHARYLQDLFGSFPSRRALALLEDGLPAGFDAFRDLPKLLPQIEHLPEELASCLAEWSDDDYEGGYCSVAKLPYDAFYGLEALAGDGTPEERGQRLADALLGGVREIYALYFSQGLHDARAAFVPAQSALDCVDVLFDEAWVPFTRAFLCYAQLFDSGVDASHSLEDYFDATLGTFKIERPDDPYTRASRKYARTLRGGKFAFEVEGRFADALREGFERDELRPLFRENRRYVQKIFTDRYYCFTKDLSFRAAGTGRLELGDLRFSEDSP